MKRNQPLEKWCQLAEGKAILIYKDRKRSTLKKQWDADDVLTSPRSQDVIQKQKIRR